LPGLHFTTGDEKRINTINASSSTARSDNRADLEIKNGETPGRLNILFFLVIMRNDMMYSFLQKVAAFSHQPVSHKARRDLLCVGILLLMLIFPGAATYAGTASTLIGVGVPPAPAINQLVNPSGVAVDNSGNVYIADTLQHRVLKMNAAGNVSILAGTGVAGFSGDGGPATLAQLNSPFDVEVDAAGNVYIADSLNHRIRKVSPLGKITTVAGTGIPGIPSLPDGDGGPAVTAQLNTPRGVDVDALGNLYIADSLDHRIRMVNTSGIISTVAGNGLARFSGDAGLATAASLNAPRDIAVNHLTGEYYISDQLNHRVRKVANGLIMTLAGTGTAGYLGDGGDASLAQLNKPAGIDVDNNGRVYVADSLNHRIRMIDHNDIIVSLMGTTVPGFSGDGGAARLAQLHLPNDVAIDATFSVVIADKVNNRVRRISGGDQDWDDVLDGLDAFINDPAAARDSDGDGAPDNWTAIASLMQIGASTLSLDEFPADPLQQLSPKEVPFGVNLSGAELTPNALPGRVGTDYTYPTAEELDYYRKKGFTYLRLPVLWERLQPVAGGTLKSAELARLDAFLNEVRKRKMKVIIDLHNYGRYHGVLTTAAALADFWGKMSAHYVNNTAIFAYDLMNEPHNMQNRWQNIAQASVNAIRLNDQVHAVIVAGGGWSTALHWEQFNANLTVTDSANNLLFEAHQYFDADSSGRYLGASGRKYSQTYQFAHGTRSYQDVLAERLYIFVGWLKKHGYRGMLGEFGVPAGAGIDPAWLNLLTPLIQYLQTERVGWTYWAGGPWWNKDAMAIEPAHLVTGPDKPQMQALLPLMDSDGDGVTNDKDAFASDFVAYTDTDGDGFPDFFNPAATQAQIDASGLILDEFPHDPNRWHVPPIANPDFATVIAGQSVIINVLLNDHDPNPLDPISLLSTDSISANGGLVIANPDGTVRYTALPSFSGTDSFLYTIRDLKGATATAAVTVTVAADQDRDGVPDSQDAFPLDPAASVDTDGDGFPDGWNNSATFSQIGTSPLLLDEFPADPAQSRIMREIPKGITLSGAEWGSRKGRFGKDYTYPNARELNYFKKNGLRYIRFPIKWERLQPKFNRPFSKVELRRMDRFIRAARIRKMKVIIDLDNASIPMNKINNARLADFWLRMAGHYANEAGVYGYEILDSSKPIAAGRWQAMVQAAVNSIRSVDTVHTVIIPGDGWSSAKNWLQNNQFFSVVDPFNNILIEAHQFFDANGSGLYKVGRKKYKATYRSVHGKKTPDRVVAEHLNIFVGWLKKNNYRGELGEFGVPAGRGIDRTWLKLIRPLVLYLNRQEIAWSYWHAGPWTVSNPMSVEPKNLIKGPTKPQLRILKRVINRK